MTRLRIPLILQCLTFLIPLNIYAIGKGMGSGVQWALFRYQDSYAGVSFISVINEFGYVLSGMITGRSALSLTAGLCGTCMLVAALCLILFSCQGKTVTWVKPASILTIIAGIAFVISCFLQYGIFLNGPAGFVIPVGIPLVFVIGAVMYTGYYRRILPGDDEDDNNEEGDDEDDEDDGDNDTGGEEEREALKDKEKGASSGLPINKYQLIFLFLIFFLFIVQYRK
ncbi:hypothetical protein [uncultured Methanoregula sp.]|uniref:hypothetical protein n=1 Tax=uncultured Methanoregula sp. TaxID=1005933 RepID=UPI002AAA6AC5|nr:hypothetical protein [uncultured Methanoregula sp.]